MSVIFDNLTAMVVGTVLLGAFLALQLRGAEKGQEAAQRYQAEALVGEMARVFERELENVRSRPETERAFATPPGQPTAGPDTYRFRLRRATTADGTAYTSLASFPTLLRPDDLSRSPIGIVTYHAEETDRRVEVDGSERTLLRVTRYVYPRGGPVRRSGVYEGLIGFDIVALGAGGAEITEADVIAGQPTRLRLGLEVAPQGPGPAAGPLTGVAHGRTVRVAAAATLVGSSPVDLTAAGGIPDFPGDPGVSPPPEPDPSDPADPAPDGPGMPVMDEDGDYVICHDPPNQADTKHIGPATLAGHLAHGDTFGPCPGD